MTELIELKEKDIIELYDFLCIDILDIVLEFHKDIYKANNHIESIKEKISYLNCKWLIAFELLHVIQDEIDENLELLKNID